jgi:hypothetical protein
MEFFYPQVQICTLIASKYVTHLHVRSLKVKGKLKLIKKSSQFVASMSFFVTFRAPGRIVSF